MRLESLEVAPKTSRGRTYVRLPLIDRLADGINYLGPFPDHRPDLGACWVWIKGLNAGGYGQLSGGQVGAPVLTHRLSYLLHHGEIPDGLHLDHLCRNRACCNPVHLEPVTHSENIKRGARATQTHCKHGHEYSPENTLMAKDSKGRLARKCKACRKMYVADLNRRKKLANSNATA